MAQNPSEQAKKFIDASLKGSSKAPSKAAYTRAVKLARLAIEVTEDERNAVARLAIEELTVVATRVRS